MDNHSTGIPLRWSEAKRKDEVFCDMMRKFGSQQWPAASVMARECRVSLRGMNRRLGVFVAMGWITVGERDEGLWLGEVGKVEERPGGGCGDQGTSEAEDRRETAGLPRNAVEERLTRLREAREEAVKKGHFFDGSKVIEEVLGS
jgi:hypothetical protein